MWPCRFQHGVEIGIERLDVQVLSRLQLDERFVQVADTVHDEVAQLDASQRIGKGPLEAGDGLPRRPLRIGRASTSWRLTSRLADSGITPDRRLRAWATTRSVRPTRVFRSLIARCSRPLRCPVAVHVAWASSRC